MIKSFSKYYRTRLFRYEEKIIYDTVLAGVENQQEMVAVDSKLVKNISLPLDMIILYVLRDSPGIFYIDSHKMSFHETSQEIRYIPNYLFPKHRIESLESEIRQKVRSFIREQISPYQTEYEKELIIHDYLVSNAEYYHYAINYHKVHSVVGALLHGRTVCSGYSSAFKLLCDAVGISCIKVSGDASDTLGSGRHAWNIVRINGKCYHVDVTADGGAAENNKINYDYFNLNDDDIGQDYTWDRDLYPKCFSMEDNYYARQGLYITSREAFQQHLVAGVIKRQTDFTFKVDRSFEKITEIQEIVSASIDPLLDNYSFSTAYKRLRGVISISIDYNPCKRD